MAFLFGRGGRQKSPVELSRALKDLIPKLATSSPSPPGQALSKNEEEVAKYMSTMKTIVQGTPDVDSSPEAVHNLIHAIIQDDLLYDLARNLRYLPFEARKDTQILFSHILRFRPANTPPTNPPSDPSAISYLVLQRPEIIIELCHGYSSPKSAMQSGQILRQALSYDTIAAVILYDESYLPSSPTTSHAVQLKSVDVTQPQSGKGTFWSFFQWINTGTFEVSSDAFTTFRDLLTKHKALVSQYLSTNYTLFFTQHFNSILLQSTSYVTKRQSIKLLGELLLDRSNYAVMTRYVASGDHLKETMNLLKDDRKMVQYEAFHVFKVFVANPNKSEEVRKILIKNKGRLLRFLPAFLDGRTDDDQFLDERSFLIRQVEILPDEVDGSAAEVGDGGAGG